MPCLAMSSYGDIFHNENICSQLYAQKTLQASGGTNHHPPLLPGSAPSAPKPFSYILFARERDLNPLHTPLPASGLCKLCKTLRGFTQFTQPSGYLEISNCGLAGSPQLKISLECLGSSLGATVSRALLPKHPTFISQRGAQKPRRERSA